MKQDAVLGAPARALIQKFAQRSATVAVVGLGYVGLPLALRFAEVGFRTLGLDIDPAKVAALGRGESYIGTISRSRVAAALRSGMRSSTDFAEAGAADAIAICVPTPLGAAREPDLSYVVSTIEALAPHLRAGQLLSLESTTYPGTTEEVVAPRIVARGLRPGDNFFVVYSPEREDPGNPHYVTQTIPKLCGGLTPACLEVGTALYGAAIDRVVPLSSARAAEMAKLLENIHRAVNIGLVNEMKIVADRMGLDIHEIVRAASTKPFGFTPYYPGPGLGGHCIPIDPFYLTWKARQLGVDTRFIELAGEVNRAMPQWVVDKVSAALNERERPVKGSGILVLGIAYKKNVEDVRESPAAAIMELLRARGARLAYSDPMVPVFPRMRDHRFELESVALSAEALASFDCVVLVTDHDAFDYEMIAKHARLLVDTRGRYAAPRPNIVQA